MEKILLAVDSIHPDRNALDFSCYLARLTKSAITGVFLEDLAVRQWVAPISNYANEFAGATMGEPSDEYAAKLEQIEKNIFLFKEGCSNREICYKVHRDSGVPLQELIEETRFADLLVVAPTTSFIGRFESNTSSFIRNILRKSECPVIIAPESFGAIDEIVFSYTPSAASMFAIKHFTYLFPQLYDKKIRVIQVNGVGKWLETEKYKLKEWLNCYYADFLFEAIRGDMTIELFDYLLERKNALLIMGVFGRNFLSRFFPKNNSDLLIQTVAQPIFITHG